MSRILFVLAVLVSLFVLAPFAMVLRDAIGPAGVSIVALVFAAMAAWLGHSADYAEMSADFRAAMRDCNVAQKEVAIAAETSEPTIANQLNGKEPPSRLWRALAALGPKFRVAFYKHQLARAECAVLERGELCDLVNAVQVMTADRRRPFAEVA